jgi:hypothetical protein
MQLFSYFIFQREASKDIPVQPVELNTSTRLRVRLSGEQRSRSAAAESFTPASIRPK